MSQNTSLIILLIITFLKSGITLECYKCRSDMFPTCATNPGKDMDVKDCLDTDECVMAVINGITHRNCLSTLLPNRYCAPPLCKSCKTPLCNEAIIPADRLLCYQCTGKECLNVDESKLKPMACLDYMKKDRCFTNKNIKDEIERGCVSKNLETCTNICLKCNYNGCNNEHGI